MCFEAQQCHAPSAQSYRRGGHYCIHLFQSSCSTLILWHAEKIMFSVEIYALLPGCLEETNTLMGNSLDSESSRVIPGPTIFLSGQYLSTTIQEVFPCVKQHVHVTSSNIHVMPHNTSRVGRGHQTKTTKQHSHNNQTNHVHILTNKQTNRQHPHNNQTNNVHITNKRTNKQTDRVRSLIWEAMCSSMLSGAHSGSEPLLCHLERAGHRRERQRHQP